MTSTNLNELIYWNNQTYGQAIIIQKQTIKTIVTILCIVTPGTNWLIPIIITKIKKNLTIRY